MSRGRRDEKKMVERAKPKRLTFSEVSFVRVSFLEGRREIHVDDIFKLKIKEHARGGLVCTPMAEYRIQYFGESLLRKTNYCKSGHFRQ